jgi:hypothetical protein
MKDLKRKIRVCIAVIIALIMLLFWTNLDAVVGTIQEIRPPVSTHDVKDVVIEPDVIHTKTTPTNAVKKRRRKRGARRKSPILPSQSLITPGNTAHLQKTSGSFLSCA